MDGLLRAGGRTEALSDLEDANPFLVLSVTALLTDKHLESTPGTPGEVGL